MMLSILSLKAQTSDLTNTVRQLIATHYLLPACLPVSLPIDYDICRSPYVEFDELSIEYASLNNYTLSQIYAIYYVVPYESANAKAVCAVVGGRAQYGVIKIYTNAYTGDKNHVKTVEYPINRWIW